MTYDNLTPPGYYDVLYRRPDGKGTHLYARMPGLPLAVQQFQAAVSKTQNPRCPYTLIWIKGLESDYTWAKSFPEVGPR